MGNGEAKELICTTHRHEPRREECEREVGAGQRGIKRRKNWDNCNSIINKIYFFFFNVQFRVSEVGSKIGGSGVHFPLGMGGTPTQSSEEQSEQPTVSQHL